MKLRKKLTLLLLALVAVSPAYSQGLKAFKLKNGLTVCIWEDETKPDVMGMVGVRTGAVNDPAEYTGLAHYLEHMLFKGTQKIGSLNWEEEAPIYEQIIAKYDEMADETDPVKKDAISKEINQLTVSAAKVSTSNEFSNLMESMGGKDVNAATGMDMTYYHNSFPPYQINKWLEISAQRFKDPVFRTFQPELETVYEEFNRSKDNLARSRNEFIMSKAYEGHPYSRSVLGLGEHLKNPRLSQLIKFYEEWYVPENMVLVLVGNVKTDQIANRIAATFGRLPARPAPERVEYPTSDIKGNKSYSAKIGNTPSLCLAYNGVPAGHPDEYALEIVMSLLSNNNGTGVLDKLSIDGQLTYAGSYLYPQREMGRCMINVMPLYDNAQRRYESNKSAERKVLKAIQQISKGEIDEWLVQAIKLSMCREYDLMMESNKDKASYLMTGFINDVDFGRLLTYKEEIMAIDLEDIKRVAKTYLNNDYLTLNIEQGKPAKKDKIVKPGYDPIEPPVGQQSMYAMQFKSMPIGQVEENFQDFAEVQTRNINDRSKLYYTLNPENEVFTLTLRYGAGKKLFPKLGIAADLMNDAGIMGLCDAQELKKEMGNLNITCSVSANDDYMTITMYGYENNLIEACQLLSRQIFMPKLDENQLNRIKGSMIGSRQHRKDNVQVLGNALNQFLFYGDQSSYIQELTDKELIDLDISSLTGDINRAANYEAEIFYTGTLSFDNVYDVLSNNLPLVANEKESVSPQPKPLAEVKENTVYFLPNNDAEQAQIYFFMPTKEYDKSDDVLIDAFYQYFSGSFNGLVLNELREKRSMVYTAYGVVGRPVLPGHPTYFIGQIGTQNDKANEAVSLYMDLLRNMPQNPDRMDNIKSYMRQEALSTQPEFRQKAMQIQYNQRIGYDQDPAIENLPKIDNLTFEDLLAYYDENIKDMPMAIAIMGNPKMIDMEELKKLGKVVRINEKRLFNTKDTMFQ